MKWNLKKISLLLLALAAIVIVLFYIPVKVANTVVVRGDYSTLAQQINDPEHWYRWNFDSGNRQNSRKNKSIINDNQKKRFHINIGDSNFLIEILSPVSFSMFKNGTPSNSGYSFKIVPTIKEDSFHLLVKHNENIFNFLFGSSEKSYGNELALNIKNFMENPSSFYGYPIEMTTTSDLKVITIRDTVALVHKWENLNEMYDKLEHFIIINHLQQVQKRIAYFKNYLSDSLVVMAGIAVDQLPKSSNTVEVVQMPEARILMGKFKGPYFRITEVYAALSNYAEDHKYQNIALPFERYLSDSTPLSDSSVVEIEVYYPIR